MNDAMSPWHGSEGEGAKDRDEEGQCEKNGYQRKSDKENRVPPHGEENRGNRKSGKRAAIFPRGLFEHSGFWMKCS